jgi:hypothetical protein
MMNCFEFCLNFAFKLNMRRYNKGKRVGVFVDGPKREVGRYRLTL